MDFRDSLNIESLAQVTENGEVEEDVERAQIITVGEGRPTVISLAGASRKIPRPPNAFMLYANTWRRKLARVYPGESNKEISIRLGKLWKTMSLDEKESYYRLAREVDAEHKRKYPDYVYNPKEARLRKALRDQGRIQRPRQKWKPSAAPNRGHTPVLQMLNQRAEEIRSQAMLQNYNDAFPDLSYPHLNMPPAGDYALVAPGPEQPWYNAYVHHGSGGLQNGGELFGRDSKGPSEWGSYHSDQDSPYMPQQMSNSSTDGHYPPMQQVPQMMGQQMQMEGALIMSSHEQIPGTSQDPLIMGDVHNEIMTNGVDNTHLDPSSNQIKEEENLPRLNGLHTNVVSTSSGDGNKDVLKLPGFHQTFGNITEIGRFSQHDDYFESRPSEVEQPKVLESSDKRSSCGSGYELPHSTSAQSLSCIWPSSECNYSKTDAYPQVIEHFCSAYGMDPCPDTNGKCQNDFTFPFYSTPKITDHSNHQTKNNVFQFKSKVFDIGTDFTSNGTPYIFGLAEALKQQDLGSIPLLSDDLAIISPNEKKSISLRSDHLRTSEIHQ